MTQGIEGDPFVHHLEVVDFHEYSERRTRLTEELYRYPIDDQRHIDAIRRLDDWDCTHHEHYSQLVENQHAEMGDVSNSN